MLYSENIRMAMNIAYKAHDNQIDKAGYPYIQHPILVASKMTDEDSTIVALLHDVVEDTPITLAELAESGFNTDIIEAVGLLTKTPKQDYIKYIRRIKKNEIARKVKIEDLRHNMDLTRLDTVTERDLRRVEKYRRAIEILEDL
ncbi:MAG: HD domain-containing protein [bacterium]|nr:HD domain-containing protein [bacterium]